MLGMGISEITRLTQEEGLYDHEIALLLGVHRTTVTRIRQKHDIPKANLANRKDKVAYCAKCSVRFIIRRRYTRRLCFECAPLVDGVDTVTKEVKKWSKKKQQ